MTSEKIKIRENDEYIRLDNLLKLSGAVMSGGEAKAEIQGGKVRLNGEICTERGKKLRRGDRVEYRTALYEVC